MPKANVIKRSFTSGYISSSLFGRTDTPAYENGVAQLDNFIVTKQGMIKRRPGVEYIGAMYSQANGVVKLKEFQFAFEDSYLLEMGQFYIRVWRNDALVKGGSPKVIDQILSSSGMCRVVTTQAHGFTTGDTVLIDGVVGTTEANGEHTITVDGTTTFLLDGVFFVNAYVAGGVASNTALVLTTPYSTSDLDGLRFAQSADTMWIVHPDHAPHILRRFSAVTWQLSEFETEDGPYLSGRVEEVTVPVTGTQNFSGIIDVNTTYNPFQVNNWVEIKDVAGTTEANGKWQNVSSSKDKVRLTDSNYSNAYTSGGTVTARVNLRISNVTDEAVLYSTSGSSPGFDSGDDVGNGRVIEFKHEGEWLLAKITEYIDGNTAKVDIFENYLGYVDPSVETKAKFRNETLVSRDAPAAHNKLTRQTPQTGVNTDSNSATLTTDFAIFKPGDVGKYFRPTNTTRAPQSNPGKASTNWWWIKEYVDDAKVKAHLLGNLVAAAPTGWPTTDFQNVRDYDASTTTLQMVERTRTCRINADFHYFTDGDVGTKVRFRIGGLWSWGKITSVTTSGSTNYAVVEYEGDIPFDFEDSTKILNQGVVEEFRMGAWTDENGYPSVVGFHDGRLIFAATKKEPQTFWMSAVEDYKRFTPTERDGLVTDDLAITATLTSRSVNAIQWIESQNVLMFGTTTGEWQIRGGGSNNDPITPHSIQVLQQSSSGSRSGLTSLVTGTSVLFVHRERDRIMEMSYDFELDAWQPRELSAHAHDYFSGFEVKRIALQQSEENIVWILGSQGLRAVTLERTPPVAAFWSFEPGSFKTFNIRDIETVSNPSTFSTDLYLAVNAPNTGGDAIFKIPGKGGTHLDYSLSKVANSNTITGLNTVFADGTLVTASNGIQYVVTGGEISGEDLFSGFTYRVGLPFESKVAIPPLEGGSAFGTSHGKAKRTPKFTVGLQNTGAISFLQQNVGTVGDGLEPNPDVFTPETKVFVNGGGFFTEVFWPKSGYDEFTYVILASSGIHGLNIVYVAPQQHAFE